MADKKPTTDEIIAQYNALQSHVSNGTEGDDMAALKKVREKYSADRAALSIQFKAALISEEASHLPEAAADAIYQRAWNESLGDGNGLYGLFDNFVELVDLADKILAAK